MKCTYGIFVFLLLNLKQLFLPYFCCFKGIVCDVRDMKNFADGSFDVVIDKGTMDAVMVGS